MAKAKPGGRARASGNFLTNHQAAIVEAMITRGDRDHDIAAWFGVNQGRIVDVKEGKHGPLPPADPAEIPPAGSPGPKAKRLRSAANAVSELLVAKGRDGVDEATEKLRRAIDRFDVNE